MGYCSHPPAGIAIGYFFELHSNPALRTYCCKLVALSCLGELELSLRIAQVKTGLCQGDHRDFFWCILYIKQIESQRIICLSMRKRPVNHCQDLIHWSKRCEQYQLMKIGTR